MINFSRDSSIDIKIIQYHRLLSDWLNIIGRSGFAIEKVFEPRPDDETIRLCPHIEHGLVAPDVIIFRLRKNGGKGQKNVC